MHGKPAPALDDLRMAIAAAVPELAESRLEIINNGWDSAAVDADGEWIFKFPRTREAEARLRREFLLLRLVAARTPVPVPQMVLHTSPVLFSQHPKLGGRSLETAEYESLSDAQREQLAATLGAFYAALHAIPLEEARRAGAVPIDPWLDAETTLQRATPALPAHLLGFLRQTVDSYRQLPEDDLVLGYFDGHGWNMAFDHEAGLLRGLFDFADAGLGSRHQDLSYSNWISRDLTLRLVGHYERLTGRTIDRSRVMLCSAMLRCVEFAAAVPDKPELGERLAAIAAWADGGP